MKFDVNAARAFSGSKRHFGFTLIELMIVVVIIGILGAVAAPMYASYSQRSRVIDGISGLSQMGVRMEQYFQDNRTYEGACQANTVAPLPPATANFTFSCPTLTATTYIVAATGVAQMTGMIYTLAPNNTRATTGVPTSGGWTGAPATCWVLRLDGTC